jgi:hypothetical protein
MPMPPSPLARLGGFRTELHACYTRRADALFELGDALLCAQAFSALPHLSLEPVCRRGWGSVYDALASGRVQVERLRDLLVSNLPDADPLVFAVDVTTWPRAATPSARHAAATTTIRPATRPASRSSPAGPTSGSASSASTATPGPPRSTPSACTRWTTPTAPPPCRSARCWGGWATAGRCRWWCSMLATTLPSSPWTWPSSVWRCWCGCAPTVASTPTRRPRHRVRPAGRGAMVPSSTVPTPPPGRSRPPPSTPSMTSTAP